MWTEVADAPPLLPLLVCAVGVCTIGEGFSPGRICGSSSSSSEVTRSMTSAME